MREVPVAASASRWEGWILEGPAPNRPSAGSRSDGILSSSLTLLFWQPPPGTPRRSPDATRALGPRPGGAAARPAAGRRARRPGRRRDHRVGARDRGLGAHLGAGAAGV